MTRITLLRGLAVAAVLAATAQPASAQLFGDGNVFCSLLSIGCPPPPPPPPPPAPVVEAPAPANPVHRVRKKKKIKPAAAAAKTDAAKTDASAPDTK